MRSRADVIVVGAGPAGAACALELARAGRRVVILEKTPPPRYKTCGGGVILRARNSFGVEISTAIETECRAAEMAIHDTGLAFRVERDSPLVTMTMRAELDRVLLEAALVAGAELDTPCELRDLEWRVDGVDARTSRGTVRADWVVAADGALGRTARAAGWRVQEAGIPALESELRVDRATRERFDGTARFDFGPGGGGYAWVFPKREHLSVGCLSVHRGTRGLKDALGRYLERVGIAPHEAREDHGFVIPLRPRRELARKRVLLTGDAAGLADPLTCEGISHASRSGRLAAWAIAGADGRPEAIRRSYRRALGREILPELQVARLLGYIVYSRPKLRDRWMRRLGAPFTRAMTEVIVGQRSYRSFVRRPRSYLRLVTTVLGRSAAAP